MPVAIYVKAAPFDKSLVTLALESGADGVIVDQDRFGEVHALGRIEAVAPTELSIRDVRSKEDEEAAARDLGEGRAVLLEQGWEVIPVENLLASGSGRLGLEVDSLEQARLAATILERGADFLVVCPQGASELKRIVQEIKLSEGSLELEPAEITEIIPVGLGHRVCVDTCSLLRSGQGLLVGNSSGFTFLVHAETEANPYVNARPFRINAGAVHSYVHLPGDRTAYLEELRAGDEVLVVGWEGGTSIAAVGRVKVEVRPLLLLSARTAGGRSGQIFVQNAETIRLLRDDGTPASVVSLGPGDEVLVRTDTAGRHFGRRIQETIEER
jgi:3-dehydroquinate synthase II